MNDPILANSGAPMSAPKRDDKSISRSLGEFVGHIWRGVTGDVAPDKREVKRTVEEEERETDQGKVTLRRTTIEEIEFKKD
jgi:hypothetical protein